MPLAARVLDMHVCPMVDVLKPHVGGPITGPGVTTVLIEGMPAAVVGDIATCVGPPDAIAKGSSTVLIGGRPAARQTDLTSHGGSIAAGCKSVMIDEGGGGGGGGGAGAGAGGAGAGPGRVGIGASGIGANGGGSSASAQAAAALQAAAVSAAAVAPSPQAHALLEAAQEGTALVEKCPLKRGRSA